MGPDELRTRPKALFDAPEPKRSPLSRKVLLYLVIAPLVALLGAYLIARSGWLREPGPTRYPCPEGYKYVPNSERRGDGFYECVRKW